MFPDKEEKIICHKNDYGEILGYEITHIYGISLEKIFFKNLKNILTKT